MTVELNNVYHGDCLDIMPFIQDKSINLILSDIPYGTTKCAWDSVIDLPKLWNQYLRVIKDNGVIVLFAQTPFDKVLGASNLPMLRYEWIWEKTSATGHFNAKKAPMKAHENILVFYNKLPTYNPIKTQGHIRKTAYKKMTLNSEVYNDNTSDVSYDSTDRYPRSIQVFPSDKQKLSIHPTQKPLDLAEYLVKTYTNVGDTMLDSCSGSGTFGLAAQRNNRNFIMIDKDLTSYINSMKRVNIKQ